MQRKTNKKEERKFENGISGKADVYAAQVDELQIWRLLEC